jgi:hypothetical protein
VLRVGVAEAAPWVVVHDTGVAGIEPSLVLGLARELQARPEWHRGSETRLLEALHDRKLDLVIGGFTTDSPWKSEVAFTAPYDVGRAGGHHAMALAPGENAWMMRVEHYLRAHGPAVIDSVSRTTPGVATR